MNENYKKLLDLLSKLKNEHYASGLKLELETEIISTEEIDLAKKLVTDAGLELTLKISGCSAVSDIFLAKVLEVQNILVPMIESKYALEKFYSNAKEILDGENVKLLFNIETVNALNNFDEILQSRFIKFFDSVVFGRNDFCSSIGKTADYADSKEIFAVACNILSKIKNKDMNFILGGNISNSSIDFMKKIDNKNFKKFETRKITFDVNCLKKNPEKALSLALEFELLWLNSKTFCNNLDEKRKTVICERISKNI